MVKIFLKLCFRDQFFLFLWLTFLCDATLPGPRKVKNHGVNRNTRSVIALSVSLTFPLPPTVATTTLRTRVSPPGMVRRTTANFQSHLGAVLSLRRTTSSCWRSRRGLVHLLRLVRSCRYCSRQRFQKQSARNWTLRQRFFPYASISSSVNSSMGTAA